MRFLSILGFILASTAFAADSSPVFKSVIYDSAETQPLEITTQGAPTFGLTNVSSGNSTTTPLGISGVFTGTCQTTDGYANVSVAVLADQVGTLEVEWSTDNCSTFYDDDTYTIPANNGAPFVFGASSGKYFRVKYTNGGIAQSSFQLQTRLHPTALRPTSHRLGSDPTDENDVDLVKSIISGKKEDGTYANAVLSNSGSVTVAVTDRPSEVRSRVKKTVTFEFVNPATTPGTTIYTVTSGYTYYVTGVFITAVNNSNQFGRVVFRDGTCGGSSCHKLPMILTERVTGAAAGAIAPSPGLPEPIAFSTSVNLLDLAGDVTVSGSFFGYEEPNP